MCSEITNRPCPWNGAVAKGAMYVIPINRCRTSAQKCDWLAQIAEKTWGTPEVLGYLVQALDAVVGLRPEVGER